MPQNIAVVASAPSGKIMLLYVMTEEKITEPARHTASNGVSAARPKPADDGCGADGAADKAGERASRRARPGRRHD